MFFNKLILLFIQFSNLFIPNSSSLEEISSSPLFSSFNKQEQKDILYSLSQAGGLDGKISESEWLTYQRFNKDKLQNAVDESSINAIDEIIKNNNRIKTLDNFTANLMAKESQNINQIDSSDLKQEKVYDIVIYGNELPGIAVAVMANRKLKGKGKIVLVRQNEENDLFGGLIAQASLSYLDRNQIDSNLTPSSYFFQEFLIKSKVKKIALDKNLADQAIRNLLKAENIEIINNAKLKPILKNNYEIDYLEIKNSNIKIKAHSYIDTTQNADLAREAGLKYTIGFETLGFPNSTLPVSPVFETIGLSVEKLKLIEKKILNNPVLMRQIRDKVIQDCKDLKYSNWVLKNLNKEMFIGIDYIDFRSIAFGVAYHLYKNKPYNLKQGFLMDKPNIAILPNNKLSWNAFLYKFNSQEVLSLINNDSHPTGIMLEEIKSFNIWLNSLNNSKEIITISPKELYIRHLINITEVVTPLTGKQIVRGGFSPINSVGSFSYYFDVRGGIDGISGTMPKATFNFGIEHTLSRLNNLAIVGKSAGYSGLAPAIGRILELNTSIGANIGIAAALATEQNKPIQSISSTETRLAMENTVGLKTPLKGIDLLGKVYINNIQ